MGEIEGTNRRLRWRDLYREAELYKAAVRLYTAPLFNWRKALGVSSDARTLYDFARRGLERLDAIHLALREERFHFRPGLALRYTFNGKERTLYIYPWEERLVDLLLYRLLGRRLHGWFSPRAYAYRYRGFGVDRCQRAIARLLRRPPHPLFILKRDIADYFPSVDHDVLLRKLADLVDPDDSLFRLLGERIRFPYLENHAPRRASRGIPFGTAIACFFANLYLTGLDRRLEQVPGLVHFRYGDDFLAVSPSAEAVREAACLFDEGMRDLLLRSKASHEKTFRFGGSFLDCGKQGDGEQGDDGEFTSALKFRHLGLEFRAGGRAPSSDVMVALSRDKFRKLCNLFRFAFRRRRSRLTRISTPIGRIRKAVECARAVILTSVRNVAIIDYYLRHVEDEEQLRRLDRWLAEEVLFIGHGMGHRKGAFRKTSYGELRNLGLPSLVHRRRLIRHGHVKSPFFVWKEAKRVGGTAARRGVSRKYADALAFPPGPKAATGKNPREGEGSPVDGRY